MSEDPIWKFLNSEQYQAYDDISVLEEKLRAARERLALIENAKAAISGRRMPRAEAKDEPAVADRLPEEECSFCLSPRRSVRKLVTPVSGIKRPPVHICEECVVQAVSLLVRGEVRT